MSVFSFACPACRDLLVEPSSDQLFCRACSAAYSREQGIWRLLAADRPAAYDRFVREYEAIRRAEGRGSAEAAYYQDLPYQDRSGRMSADWKIRAASFDALIREVVTPLERQLCRSLCILDLGAGNGWLSNRLAQRGHAVAAVDLLVNPLDGLGAWVHYPVQFVPVQAEFDRLPFVNGQADLAIFNASLHYSTAYEVTLLEAKRVLRPGGRLVVLDTPVYRDPASGAQMVAEREKAFGERYGFASNALASENYLTFDRLEELETRLGLHWRKIAPDYGLKWRARAWKARLLRRREPASFYLLDCDPVG